MSNPSLCGFYDIILLLDLIHADQSFSDGIDMEYRASRTGFDNIDNAAVFLLFRNVLPRILARSKDSKSIPTTKIPCQAAKALRNGIAVMGQQV